MVTVSGPDSTRNGSYIAGDFHRRLKIDIANQPIIRPIDPNIDHDRTGFEHRCGYKLRPAYRCDDDIRLGDRGCQIGGAAMTQRHRRVSKL